MSEKEQPKQQPQKSNEQQSQGTTQKPSQGETQIRNWETIDTTTSSSVKKSQNQNSSDNKANQ